MDVDSNKTVNNNVQNTNNPVFFSFGGEENNILNNQTSKKINIENNSINNFNDYFKYTNNISFNNNNNLNEVRINSNPNTTYLPTTKVNQSLNQIKHFSSNELFNSQRFEEKSFELNKNSKNNNKSNFFKLNNHLINNNFRVSILLTI